MMMRGKLFKVRQELISTTNRFTVLMSSWVLTRQYYELLLDLNKIVP